MRNKLICCEVFYREICQAMLDSNHSVFPVFTTKLSHECPNTLRESIQQEIDKTDPKDFKTILLGYGLCGNAISGITARNIPLVIPRAHDCCTILLGSIKAYREHFSHRPSCQWTSGGYMGSGENYLRDSEIHKFLGSDMTYQELVEKYGEENAAYILETLTPKDGSNDQVVFIQTTPYERMNLQTTVEADAQGKGCTFEFIKGNTRLLQMLAEGEWPQDEFLMVPPGYRIEGVYDHEQIMKAVRPNPGDL